MRPSWQLKITPVRVSNHDQQAMGALMKRRPASPSSLRARILRKNGSPVAADILRLLVDRGLVAVRRSKGQGKRPDRMEKRL